MKRRILYLVMISLCLGVFFSLELILFMSGSIAIPLIVSTVILVATIVLFVIFRDDEAVIAALAGLFQWVPAITWSLSRSSIVLMALTVFCAIWFFAVSSRYAETGSV